MFHSLPLYLQAAKAQERHVNIKVLGTSEI